MDLKTISAHLEEKYNCKLINTFKYSDYTFIKGIDISDGEVTYRYFQLNNNDIEEIKNSKILDYIKERQETNLDINY